MLAAGVERMSHVFEEEKFAREEQRRIMDALHKRTMEQIADARRYMEEMMAEVAVKIQDFGTKWDHALDETRDQLLVVLKEKVAALTARIKILEERSQKLQVGLDQEKVERIKETEARVRPIWKQVGKLIHCLGKEQRIRRRREEEIMKALEDAAESLNNNVDVEKANRAQKQKDMIDDNAYELRRLQNRQKKIVLTTEEDIEVPQEDLEHEVSTRVDSQNNVVEEITCFMERFRENLREEAQM